MIENHEIKRVQKLWGYETIPVNNSLYCGKILTVLPNGKACSIHYHKDKTETFYVLRGVLILEIYAEYDEDAPAIERVAKLRLKSGESLTIHPLTPHRFWVENEICEFNEFSTSDKPEDSYRLNNAGNIPVGE